MEKAFAKAEELADTVKEYVNNRIAAAKLNVAEKSSAVIANLAATLAVAGVLMLFILFSSIALAFCLGAWIGATWAGFLIVGGLYLLIGIIIWTARVKIIQLPVMNSILKQLFGDEDEEN
ncbi:MAG: phage holin family protein [Ferruginibacter sp.]|nr:phage holin family protein [Ferruginibacter sp.]